MKKFYVSLFLSTIVVVAFLIPGARAGIQLDLLGAGTYSMATGTPTPTNHFGFPGGGAQLDFNFNQRVQLELSGFYLTRDYAQDGVTFTPRVLMGRGALRFLLSRRLFLKLGGYTTQFVTNPEDVTGSDYGVLGGLGFWLPIKGQLALLLGADYHFALGKLTQRATGDTLTHSEVLGVVGLTLGFRGK